MSFQLNQLLKRGDSTNKKESIATSNFDFGLPRRSFKRESDSMVNDEDVRVKRNIFKNMTVKPLKRSRFAKFFQPERSSKANEIGNLISGLRRNKPHTVQENICSRLLSSQKLNFINPFQFFDKNIEPRPTRFKSALQNASVANDFHDHLIFDPHFSSLFTVDRVFNFKSRSIDEKQSNISESNSNLTLFSIKSEEEIVNQNITDLRRISQIDSSNKVLDLWRSKTLYDIHDEKGND